MDLEELLKAFLSGLSEFLDAEKDLLDVDANERALTHKLAEHLQRHFPKWHVDCEYNRLDAAVKKLPPATKVQTDDTEGQTIFPDIIVHRRRSQKNLLVIEVKKSTNRAEHSKDHEKLSGLTQANGAYGYSLGLHVIFDPVKCSVVGLTAYTAGQPDQELKSDDLLKRLNELRPQTGDAGQ